MYFQGLTKTVMAGQLIAMVLFTITGLVLLGATVLAWAGVLPWIDLPLAFGGVDIVWAGQAAQIGLTVLFLLLAVYVPSNRQVMMLEAAHRDFAMSMDDITSAYKAVHFADRRAAFQMEREFDAVRERFDYLKTHPDLPEIDAELLTIAAQMSEQSRDLARAFSEDRVTRVQASLADRRNDAVELQGRIQQANAASRDLRRQLDDLEYEESSALSQLARLREDLSELEARIAGMGPRKGRHLRPVGDAG